MLLRSERLPHGGIKIAFFYFHTNLQFFTMPCSVETAHQSITHSRPPPWPAAKRHSSKADHSLSIIYNILLHITKRKLHKRHPRKLRACLIYRIGIFFLGQYASGLQTFANQKLAYVFSYLQLFNKILST